MKQFNLEEYLRLKKEGKEPKLVTRDGKKVRILCTDMRNSYYPIVALIQHDSQDSLISYTIGGCEFTSQESRRDLFFAPTNRKGWMNIYNNGDIMGCWAIYGTEEEVKKFGKITMNRYTIYCTEEQTKKAFELGAPIVKIIEDFNAIPSCYVDKSNNLYEIPTVEQMISWLEEQGITVETVRCDSHWFARAYSDENCYFNKGRFPSRKEAILAAIDAALDYLIEN